MKNRFFLLSLLIFFSVNTVFSQSSVDKNSTVAATHISSLPLVYGWYMNPKNDKWTVKEKEIKGVDKFENFMIIRLVDTKTNEPYIAIVKERKEKGHYVFDSYVVDYKDYAQQISLWEQHTILKFQILKHEQTVFKKKGKEFSLTQLGLHDLSGISRQSRDYFVFQYKFLHDDVVKFLFYVDSSHSPSLLNFSDQQDQQCLGTDELYNRFFYKTPVHYFTKFTDSLLQ